MTSEQLFNFLIVAIVGIAMIGARFRGVKKRYGAFVAQQRDAAAQAETALQQAAAQRAVSASAPTVAPAQVQPRPVPPPPMRRIQPPSQKRSTDVPAMAAQAPGDAPLPARRMVAEAFGDPAHARGAVILAEILAPPVALR